MLESLAEHGHASFPSINWAIKLKLEGIPEVCDSAHQVSATLFWNGTYPVTLKSKPLELNDKGAEFCREKCRLLTPPFIYLASIVLPGKEEWGKQGKGEERKGSLMLIAHHSILFTYSLRSRTGRSFHQVQCLTYRKTFNKCLLNKWMNSISV